MSCGKQLRSLKPGTRFKFRSAGIALYRVTRAEAGAVWAQQRNKYGWLPAEPFHGGVRVNVVSARLVA